MAVVEDRTSARGVTRTAVLVALLLLAVPAIAAKFCALPVGAAARDATWTAIQPLIPELKKLAGDRTFVLVTRPSFGDVGRQAVAYRRGYHEAVADQLLESNAKDMRAVLANPDYASVRKAYKDEQLVSRLHARHRGRYGKEYIRVVLAASDSAINVTMTELRSRVTENRTAGLDFRDDGTTHELTYIYTDDPVAQRAIGMDGIERGVMLETSGDELRRALAADSPLTERLGDAGVVFLDRIDLDRVQLVERQGRPLIRLPAMRQAHYRRLAQLVHGTGQSEHVPFNLLPPTGSDALPWGFDRRKADDYAVAHGRVAAKLRTAGFLAKRGEASPVALVAAIEAEVNAGRRPVIIGEGTPDGKAVRLPGTDAVLDPAALSEAARRVTWFVFCNSAEGTPTAAGFSVVGRIWTRDAGDLVATLGPAGQTANSKERISERAEWLVELVALAGGGSAIAGGQIISVMCFESSDATVTCPLQAEGGV